MNPIPKLIFNLLAQRQKVVLPGLGTFGVEHTPGSPDPKSGTLITPRNKLTFSTVEESGETLPEIISRESGIPLKEVKPQYNRWLSGLKKASAHGEIAVKGVGLLIRQPDGSYWMETAKELDRLLNPIERKSIPLPVIPAGKKKPVRAKPSKPSRLKRRAGRFAALGVLLVILVYGGYYSYTGGFFDRPEASVPVSQPAVEIPVVVPQPTEPDTAKAVAPSLPATEKTLPPNHTGEVYHLIAGVFSNRENAERYVKEGGFDPARTTLIPTTGERFMVSVGKYADKADADREMKRLLPSNPQVWISKRKK